MKRRPNLSLYINGTVTIQIQGLHKERFLNICAQRELSIEEIQKNEDDSMIFVTTPGIWKQMKPIARKTGIKMRLIQRKGFPFVLHRNRKRKLLVCGTCFFFLLLYHLSFYIWDISVEGNKRFTDEMMFNYMKGIFIENGMRKSRISCEQLEAGIRDHFPDITWVSAEMKGTRLIIRIRENETMNEYQINESNPCDLHAAKSGTITDIVIRSGICRIKEGEFVEKGDLLIDGTIPIIDDAGTEIDRHEVHADGEIYANTMHTLAWKYPMTEIKKSRSGRYRKGVYLEVFGHLFCFMTPKEWFLYDKDSRWEYITKQKQLCMLNDFYLPVYIGGITAFEYDTYEHVYTYEDIDLKANDELKEYMEKLLEKGVQILGCDGKIEQSESGWQFTGTMTVNENIAMEVPVTGAETDKEKEIQL